MRTELELTYKGFEQLKDNPQYSIFRFVDENNKEYAWYVTGSPKGFLDFNTSKNEKVLLSADVDGKQLKRVKIIKNNTVNG